MSEKSFFSDFPQNRSLRHSVIEGSQFPTDALPEIFPPFPGPQPLGPMVPGESDDLRVEGVGPGVLVEESRGFTIGFTVLT